eukprot:TRINITY_DN2000_c1_g1_i1.p1 TRINITY_DN2000_c1_g1~~TRINITY_DN2000_c1_g1_i1.p1  ORF type:complete len:486 (-),score=37.31 TRINITY_DN2000_c1_g1_i1:354-1595(-)
MRDKQAFVFMFQSGDDLPVYGICCYAEEMLHRPPPLAKEAFPECTAPVSRYRLTAPRCYCLISKYPFFEWHFKVLGMIMSVQRLEHIENFMQELTLLPQIETVHSAPGLSEQSNAVHRRALSSPTANASNQNAQHMMRSDSVSSTMGMQAESFVDATEVLENIDQEGASSSARVGAEATNHHQDEEDEVLKLLKAVYKVQVPPPGGVLRFEPENGLQHISYIRADARSKTEGGVLKVATAEAAQSLRYWTVAALCRALSVESILLLLTSVMLEKQIVVFCPSIGILSAVILSVIPLIYPLQWHSQQIFNELFCNSSAAHHHRHDIGRTGFIIVDRLLHKQLPIKRQTFCGRFRWNTNVLRLLGLFNSGLEEIVTREEVKRKMIKGVIFWQGGRRLLLLFYQLRIQLECIVKNS